MPDNIVEIKIAATGAPEAGAAFEGFSAEASQALQDIGASAGDASTAADGFAAGFADAGEELNSATKSVEDASVALDGYAAGFQPAAEGAKELADEAGHAGEAAHESSESFGELYEGLVKFAEGFGIGLGLKEIATESIEAYANLERVTVSLTALKGSSQAAAENIEVMRRLADDNGLSFPAVLTADQRMSAFGFTTEETTVLVEGAADAAAATGNAFETVAQRIAIMADQGMLGKRQLALLGVTLDDVGKVLGVTGEEAAKMFLALDPGDRVEVLHEALTKFAGQGELAAKTLSGSWQETKNKFDEFFEDLGRQLAPAAQGVMSFAGRVAESLADIVAITRATLDTVEYEIKAHPVAAWYLGMSDVQPGGVHQPWMAKQPGSSEGWSGEGWTAKPSQRMDHPSHQPTQPTGSGEGRGPEGHELPGGTPDFGSGEGGAAGKLHDDLAAAKAKAAAAENATAAKAAKEAADRQRAQDDADFEAGEAYANKQIATIARVAAAGKRIGEEKAADDKRQAAAWDKIVEEGLAVGDRIAAEDAAAARKHAESVLATEKIIEDTAQHHQAAMAQLADDAAKAQLDLGEITKAQYLRIRQEQYDAEYQALLAEIARERAALAAENLPDDERAKRTATINAKEQGGTDKYDTKTAGNQKDEVANAVGNAKQVIDPIFQGFDSGIKEMISGTKTFGQAWADMGKKMVTGFADTMVKLGLQWAERQVEDLAVHKAEQAGLVTIDKGYAAAHQITGVGISAADKTQQALRTATAKIGLATSATDDKLAAASHEIVSGGVTASDAGEQIKQTGAAIAGDQSRLASTITSSGEGLAVQKADGIASRFEAAKTAAANTWASVSAIPVIGYILAPIAAAAAFAAVAAFETGGDVGGTGLALLHENEHVINAPLTKMLQHAATQPNAGGGGGGGGGGNTYHVNSSPTVHVHSEADGAKLLSDHADHIGRIVRQQSRQFNR